MGALSRKLYILALKDRTQNPVPESVEELGPLLVDDALNAAKRFMANRRIRSLSVRTDGHLQAIVQTSDKATALGRAPGVIWKRPPRTA